MEPSLPSKIQFHENNPFMVKISNYLTGILHQKLFELVTPEITQLIEKMPTVRKQEPVTIQCKYCQESVLKKDMMNHLISHKTIISQQQAETGESVVNLKMNKI